MTSPPEPGDASAPPSVASTSSAPGQGTGRPQRLHPLSPVIDLVRIAPQTLLPMVFFVAREPLVAVPLSILVAVLVIGARFLAWSRFTYVIDGDSLVVERGILNRSRRVVPLDRIQQVDLLRKLRHRIAGLAVVRVDTAGTGSEAEVTLDAVSDAEADRLRAVLGVRARDAVPAWPAAEDAGTGATTRPGSAEVEREVLAIGYRRLALAGVTGAQLAVVFAVLGSLAGLLDEVVVSMGERVVGEVADGARPAISVLIVLGVGAVVVWLAVAAGAAIVADADYRLTRRGDVLHVRRGLLDQREASLAVHRVQVVRILQNPLRRMLGLVSVTLQSAGGSGSVEGVDSRVTVPILRRAEVEALVSEVLPGAPPLPGLAAAPAAARRRAWTRRVGPALLLALPVAVLLAPWGILALLLIPIGVLDAELVYRGLGWARVGDHIVARRGGLLRETNVVPMAKVQSTRLASSPLQRRVGLANLLLDVAGRGRTPAVLDGAADDLGPLHLGALGTLAARRDEQAVRRRSTAEIAATPKAAST